VDRDAWEAVQARLAGNGVERRSGNGAAEPSKLAGLIHDDNGIRLSPSHAIKNGVNQRALKGCGSCVPILFPPRTERVP